METSFPTSEQMKQQEEREQKKDHQEFERQMEIGIDIRNLIVE